VENTPLKKKKRPAKKRPAAKPVKKLKACMLHWQDAAINSEETDVEQISPIKLLTMGWIIRETKNSITLAMDLPINQTAPPMTIPKMDIITRWDFDFDEQDTQ
jgi:hypothetical protein